MVAMLLDIVEVAKSHTGVNLALAFAQVLQDFGIEEKVSYCSVNTYSEIELTMF